MRSLLPSYSKWNHRKYCDHGIVVLVIFLTYISAISISFTLAQATSDNTIQADLPSSHALNRTEDKEVVSGIIQNATVGQSGNNDNTTARNDVTFTGVDIGDITIQLRSKSTSDSDTLRTQVCNTRRVGILILPVATSSLNPPLPLTFHRSLVIQPNSCIFNLKMLTTASKGPMMNHQLS
jgi:hypothetical protein